MQSPLTYVWKRLEIIANKQILTRNLSEKVFGQVNVTIDKMEERKWEWKEFLQKGTKELSNIYYELYFFEKRWWKNMKNGRVFFY